MPITNALNAPFDDETDRTRQAKHKHQHQNKRQQTRYANASVRIVKRLLRYFKSAIVLKLWNGEQFTFGTAAPKFTLVVNDPAVLRKLVLHRDSITLEDAYFCGLIDFEGDLFAGLRLKPYLQKLSLPCFSRASLVLDALHLPSQSESQKQCPLSDRAAASLDFDVSNEFYKLWLCDEMVYSCAYFDASDDSLLQAQRNKLDHVCDKLRLKPGESFLDIGCGWGALVCWAALNYGVKAHGITSSRRQFDYATERVKRLGLQNLVTVELRDERDLTDDVVYDKISSIGMLEHVGLAGLPAYNTAILRLLKPGGLFLNHGFTRNEEGWCNTSDTGFITKLVSPGGELDTISHILRGMEQTDFEVRDVENLRYHYAKTLRHWVQRLEANHPFALSYVSEETYRVWRFYMVTCAMEIETESTGIYQILSSKRGSDSLPVPQT